MNINFWMCVFFRVLKIHCLVPHQFCFFNLNYGVFIFMSYIIFFLVSFSCVDFFRYVCVYASTLIFFNRDVRTWLNIVDKITNLVMLNNDNWMRFCCGLRLVVKLSIQHHLWCFIFRFLPWIWWLFNKFYLKICSGEGYIDPFELEIGKEILKGKVRHMCIYVATQTLGSRPRQGCRPSRKPGSHISCSRECRRMWGNEPSHSQVSSHFGSWSHDGLLNFQRAIIGAKTHWIEKFLISLKSFWNVDV
jgi:hypothetical protein